MRARNIKPGFFKNEDIAKLPFEARILFIGLWCLADREGRLEDRPMRIRAEVFPYDRVDMPKLLDVITRHGFTLHYEINGNRYIQIINFNKHQSPHPHEAKSIYPSCNDKAVTSRVIISDSLNPSSLIPDSLNDGILAAAKASYELPNPKTNPIGCLVISYKTRKGVAYDSREWDGLNWGRSSAAAKVLLSLCKDLATSEECMKAIAEDFDAKGMTWTFETIAKHAPDWLIKTGRIDANSSRDSLRMAIARSRVERKSEGALEKVSDGALPVAVGNGAAPGIRTQKNA